MQLNNGIRLFFINKKIKIVVYGIFLFLSGLVLVGCQPDVPQATNKPDVSTNQPIETVNHPATSTQESTGQVTMTGEEMVVQERRWKPVLTAVNAENFLAIRQQAAEALKQDKLYLDQDSAIPLYLSILEYQPKNTIAKNNLKKIQRQLLKQIKTYIQESEEEPDVLFKAWEISNVVQFLDADNVENAVLQKELELNIRVYELNLAGEDELRVGNLYEENEGALYYFYQALQLDKNNRRVLNNLIATEDAIIQMAEKAAYSHDFPSAYQWLARANKVRPENDGIELAKQHIEDIRLSQIIQLYHEGLNAVTRPGDLKPAREIVDAMLQIARPADTYIADLKQRIDLATYYGVFKPKQVFTDVLKNGQRGPQMVVIPHGGFIMGASLGEKGATDAEFPIRYVRFERGFAMSITEVTVEDFGRFVADANPRLRATRRGNSLIYDERRGNFVRSSYIDWRSGYDGRAAKANDPVLHISVRDAEAYAEWLSEQTGRNYRLPSEAEFEYVLRAGSTGVFPWGSLPLPPELAGNFAGAKDISPSGRRWDNGFANYTDGFWGIAPVAQFKPNAWGVYDISGNANEWVADCWHASFRRAPKDGNAWFNPGCRSRVIRGGSWSGAPEQIRSAWRQSQDSDVTSGRVGFRLVRGI